MVYNITYKSSVKKDLRRISKPETRKILDKIEALLSKNPEQYPQLKGEFKLLRKFRIGNYRIIFTVKENDIIILKIGHRKEVYK